MSHIPKRTTMVGLAILVAATLVGFAASQDMQPAGEPQDAPMGVPHDTQSQQMPTEENATEELVIVAPENIMWEEAGPPFPNGTRLAVLSGDPAQEGPFTMRAEVPANTTIPQHTHPDTERVTIVNGTVTLEIVEDDGNGNVTELPAGSYFMLPSGTDHVFSTGNETVVIQLHGEGPWNAEFVHDENMTQPAA